jgi:tetratricopeptide (TPR) repeat protein
MNHVRSHILVVMALAAMAACSRPSDETGATMEAAPDVAMTMPVTTSSDDARNHFMLGLHAMDMGRSDDATPHFEQAIAADPGFAYAYLSLADASNSLEGFQTNLALASQNAAGASEAERLLIEIAQKGLDDDPEGQLQAARRLTEVAATSPRAWIELGNIQGFMGNEGEARASYQKAIEIAPDFAPAYMALGNSYLAEPRDLAAAQESMAKAVELAPEEAVPHDLLGDTYRAQGNLELAADEYTRTAELDTKTGSGFQQRGHVHSFMGNYDQARSDYDSAIQIEKGKNFEATFGVYRALASVHEGNAQAAIDELNALLARIDGMGIPEPRGQKLFVLDNVIQIALHNELLDAAEQAMAARAGLEDEQAEQIGTESARRDARATAILDAAWLAAVKGDYATATAKAGEYMTTVEPSTDPLKNRPAHAVLGYVSLSQEKHDEAIGHFEQANPNDPYVMYYHALALEGAGRAADAKPLFQKVAGYNFNSAGLALVRADAIAKAR